MNKHHLAIIITGILYGFIGIFVRLVGSRVHIMTLSFFRLFFGFLFVALVMFVLRKKIQLPSKKELKHFIAIGIIMALTLTTYNIAFLYAPIENVVLLVNSYVIFTAILAFIFLHERLTWKGMGIISFGLLGILIMQPLQEGILLGNILALVSGLTYALLLIYMRYEERTHTTETVFWFMLVAMLVMLPFPFFYGLGQWSSVSLWLILLGIFPTGLAYLLLAYGLEKIEADMTSTLIMIATPLASIFLGYVIFHEILNGKIILGGILLLFSGIWLEREMKRQKTT